MNADELISKCRKDIEELFARHHAAATAEREKALLSAKRRLGKMVVAVATVSALVLVGIAVVLLQCSAVVAP